ncbi:hypothetical protein RclHR1_01870010 [Rhizophagus clarus]|uniref:Uncharacterized protein n=1 Tax=Rhizophagus clarus TaxID=94130 RepID=A0A2Z6QPB8_9GLOM|nr:hypothetical protein RclHR1_01870010 [Rhizophagus clarus]
MSLILRTTYLNFGNRALVYFGMYQMYYSGVYRKDIIYLLIKVQRGNRNHLWRKVESSTNITASDHR